MERDRKNTKQGLTTLSVIGGGVAGFVVNVVLSMMTDTDMTSFYGISIFLGVIVGLLWDIAEKLIDQN
ncbi:hypothetical protein H0266_15240 [Halobacillus locisalis]|uniref:Uncharacterized protein n=1 Tax=Halobacillus locisalis TaxID=220753 RepID=A0A838CWF8_9BACI|nr:hypothetical protein [Halobacillus locisalis]MBA2176251.1 hypothetical protein [Halobacillus locisalis]